MGLPLSVSIYNVVTIILPNVKKINALILSMSVFSKEIKYNVIKRNETNCNKCLLTSGLRAYVRYYVNLRKHCMSFVVFASVNSQ